MSDRERTTRRRIWTVWACGWLSRKKEFGATTIGGSVTVHSLRLMSAESDRRLMTARGPFAASHLYPPSPPSSTTATITRHSQSWVPTTHHDQLASCWSMANQHRWLLVDAAIAMPTVRKTLDARRDTPACICRGVAYTHIYIYIYIYIYILDKYAQWLTVDRDVRRRKMLM